MQLNLLMQKQWMKFETKKDEEYYKRMDDIKEKFSDIVKFYDSILIVSEPRHKYLIGSGTKN